MRIFYAVLKATAFCWLLFLQPFPGTFPGIWAEWGGAMRFTGDVLVGLAVLICVAPGQRARMPAVSMLAP